MAPERWIVNELIFEGDANQSSPEIRTNLLTNFALHALEGLESIWSQCNSETDKLLSR